ncbi:MAG: hypothetical protein Q8L09_05400 [Candidatus Moranbacteria bacterium]|nr:hypothetical protein [Candidatus Moranbacteria bacterium]
MEGQRIFQLSDNQYDTCQIIEKIPASWQRIEGSLTAPEKLVQDGRVAEGMAMLIRQSHATSTAITGIKKGLGAKQPDYEGYYLQGKACRTVGFDFEKTYEGIPFTLIRSLISAYVRNRSIGYLLFFSKQCGDNKWAYPLLCEFRLSPWLPEGENNHEKALPPAVFFRWKTQHGGDISQFSKFFNLCRELDLQEMCI